MGKRAPMHAAATTPTTPSSLRPVTLTFRNCRRHDLHVATPPRCLPAPIKGTPGIAVTPAPQTLQPQHPESPSDAAIPSLGFLPPPAKP